MLATVAELPVFLRDVPVDDRLGVDEHDLVAALLLSGIAAFGSPLCGIERGFYAIMESPIVRLAIRVAGRPLELVPAAGKRLAQEMEDEDGYPYRAGSDDFTGVSSIADRTRAVK